MIKANLKKRKLGEILDVKRGTSLAGKYYATNGTYIRLTLGNFNYPGKGFKKNLGKEDIYFTGPIKKEFVMNKGDIITPLTEQVAGLLGETARIPENSKYIQSGDIGHIIPDISQLDDKFAYYLIASSSVKKQLGAVAQQTKIRHTSPEKIKDCVVWLPQIDYQKKAGEILDLINDKLVNNNNIVAQLESLAKTIYDYWFVQFDFPDKNGRPYKSSGGKMVWNERLQREIPDGWRVEQLRNLIVNERGISYNSSNIETGMGVPMINLASFNPGDGKYKASGLKYYQGKYPDKKKLKPYDLIMCNTQQTKINFYTDIIGRAMLVPDIYDGDVVFSHHVTVIRATDDYLKYYLLFLFNSDYFHKYISGYTNGTNILSLIFDGVNNYITEIPDATVLKKFAHIILNVYRKKSEIIKENQKLASLRDFLLPLLMNGQVSFKSDSI